MMQRLTELIPIKLGSYQGDIVIRRWPVENPRGRVICLHGLCAVGADYVVLAEQLNAAGYEVICPDWMGHGSSTCFGKPDAYSSHSFTIALAQIMAHYGQPERTHLIGTSYGGIILFMFLIASQLQVRSAVIIDIPLRWQPEVDGQGDVIRRLVMSDYANIEEAEAGLLAIRPSLLGFPERLRDYLNEARFFSYKERIRLRCDPAVLHSAALASEIPFDFRAQVARLRMPTLFYYGEESRFQEPDLFSSLEQTQTHIRYMVARDGGHPPSLSTNHDVQPIVDFIK